MGGMGGMPGGMGGMSMPNVIVHCQYAILDKLSCFVCYFITIAARAFPTVCRILQCAPRPVGCGRRGTHGTATPRVVCVDI